LSHPLIDRNRDLKRLEEDGYELEIANGNELVVRNVPSVDEHRRVQRGCLVATLSLSGDLTNAPSPHTVQWAGDFPCNEHGKPLERLRQGNVNRTVAGVVVRYSFSNKPPQGYVDYHQLVTTYVGIIQGPAEVIDPGASARKAA